MSDGASPRREGRAVTVSVVGSRGEPLSLTGEVGVGGRLQVTGKGALGALLSERHYKPDSGDEVSLRDCIPHPKQEAVHRH